MGQNDLFDLSKLRALQREAEELAERLSAAAAAVEAEFSGGDRACVVEITVGFDGAATRVRLDPGWQRAVGVTGLGSAIIDALTAATQQRLSTWAGGIVPAVGGPPVAAGQEPDRHGDLGDPSSRQSALALGEVMGLVAEVTARLPEMAEAAEAAATRSVTSTDGARRVRVTATGGMVSSVDFDDPWLRSADHQRIAATIQQALAASVYEAARARRQVFDAIPGLDRVRRLTASPDTLLREIGLLR